MKVTVSLFYVIIVISGHPKIRNHTLNFRFTTTQCLTKRKKMHSKDSLKWCNSQNSQNNPRN